ncbi:mitogen-activated protein kinase kinase kinase 5-like isoform X1 [Syzygium oleosum]|uniref:mitogen-activated protein kinase kinase kinase 5-like isoform X1 n=1 Tax=Syzygium oleosum TaxID=219896 RepID=UPI0011D23EE1|nr:mitogen-activated protein kinase kinase kinase 5-like isoform X1 [Syzygium oleosum]
MDHRAGSSSYNASPCGSPTSGGRGPSVMQRRLTRQRKLRYATDDEVGLVQVGCLSRSTPVSPESTPELRSPGRSERRCSTAVPQPLPLPEMASLRIAPDRNGLTEEGPGSEVGRKNNGHVSPKSAKPSTCYKRGFLQDLSLDNHNLRINIPARSAPASSLSSPYLSPHNPATGYFLSCKSPVPDGWSTFKGQTLTLPKSLGHLSPLQSPTSRTPGPNPKSPSGTATWYQHKSLSEISMGQHESISYINAHPLPLPPSTSNISHAAERQNVASMTGQWQKGKLIGRGTFGSVYVATNRETGALCAMKEVDLIMDDPKSVESVKQLEQEIRVLRQFKHPNIVQYYGSEIVDDHFYIYLEYVYPGSINKYVREHCGTMTESVVRNFTRHILNGLAYLHSKRTIHRDIKGANLLVDATGVVKLADFGMAKHLTGQVSILSLKGSPYWMAPEILQGSMTKEKTSPEMAFAVDIWSVGCTVIEMLNGVPPWGELEGPQAMFKVLNRSPPIPEKLSSEGKDFLQCCFQRNPAQRPSAKELLQHPFLRNSPNQNGSSFRPLCQLKWMARR